MNLCLNIVLAVSAVQMAAAAPNRLHRQQHRQPYQQSSPTPQYLPASDNSNTNVQPVYSSYLPSEPQSSLSPPVPSFTTRTRPFTIETFEYEPPSGPPDHAWRYSFTTENGISQQAEGEAKRIRKNNEEHVVVVMRGSYSYIGPDGRTYEVTWVADENGFRPSGLHLPKIPEPTLVDYDDDDDLGVDNDLPLAQYGASQAPDEALATYSSSSSSSTSRTSSDPSLASTGVLLQDTVGFL